MATCKCGCYFKTPPDEEAGSFSCPRCGYDPMKDWEELILENTELTLDNE